MGAFALPLALIGTGVAASSMGSRSSPRPPQLPAPPKPQEIMDVIDEISGTQAVTVTGPDGKKRRVIQRLPRTPQEEQLFRQGEELMSSALQNLKTLYNHDPSQVVDFAPVIETFANINRERAEDLAQITDLGNIQADVDDFKAIQKNLLNEELKQARLSQEQGLVERGHHNSTAGDSLRAQLSREEALARQQVDLNSRMYGDQIADQKFRRNLTAYDLREQGRQGQISQAEKDYALRQQQKQDLEQKHQGEIQSQGALFQMGANLRGEDMHRAMATRAPELGLQQWSQTNQDQMNRYNADINRINTGYQQRLAHHQAQPPSFLETVGSLGTGLGGAMMTAPSNSLMGRWSQSNGSSPNAGNMMTSPLSFRQFTPSIMYPSSNMLKWSSHQLGGR